MSMDEVGRRGFNVSDQWGGRSFAEGERLGLAVGSDLGEIELREKLKKSLADRSNAANSIVEDHLNPFALISKLEIWIPHVLAERKSCCRADVSALLLKRQENEVFFKYIITEDEKWVVCNNKLKWTWSKKDEPIRSTSKANFVKNKDNTIHLSSFYRSSMINYEVYCQQLDKLNDSLIWKRPELVNRKGVPFHQAPSDLFSLTDYDPYYLRKCSTSSRRRSLHDDVISRAADITCPKIINRKIFDFLEDLKTAIFKIVFIPGLLLWDSSPTRKMNPAVYFQVDDHVHTGNCLAAFQVKKQDLLHMEFYHHLPSWDMNEQMSYFSSFSDEWSRDLKSVQVLKQLSCRARDLEESPDPSMSKIVLRNLIISSKYYKEEEAKELLEVITAERLETEQRQKLEQQEQLSIEKLRLKWNYLGSLIRVLIKIMVKPHVKIFE
ncbi:putative DD34D transposase [Trichonephila clavipes]|nr:putative DD34D transposase [Trichonephila clavipes]